MPLNLGLPEWKAQQNWPNLTPRNKRVTSDCDPSYNCAAWAADDMSRPWWPTRIRGYYWPPGIAKRATLSSFEEAYATLRYSRCSDGSLKRGLEKIAVYALRGIPKHVARQLPNGRWTSKLGVLKDISHSTLADLEGNFYGYPVLFMERERRGENP